MKKSLFLFMACLAVCSVLPAQTAGEDLAILNRIMRLKMDGLIPLRFVSALDAKPVEGAAVAIDGIGTFITDSQGIITFPEQEDGFYTLQFSKQGFIASRIEFEVILNNVFCYQISVSPAMRGDYLRIVLDWGQEPADLDLHLEKEGAYHISYWDMHTASDGSVTLDYDAQNGFGPETITIMETDLRSVYYVYVHDYTNQDRPSSTALSQSGAVVRVYDRNGLIYSFRTPTGLSGNRWNVFSIINGQITNFN